MKIAKYFAALVLGIAVVACNTDKPEVVTEGEEAAAKVMTAADYLPSKALTDSISYLIGVNFGSFIKGYDFGDVNYSQILKGMKDFVAAEGTPMDPEFGKQFRVDPNLLNDMFNEYLQNRQNYVALSNQEAETEFLAKNAGKPGVQTTASGLQYEIVEQGSNDLKPGSQDTVAVTYVGQLLDGTIFDQTEEGAEPISFSLDQVIPGWSEGLQLIGEGGKIKLYIPSSLGYGPNGTQGIPPYSVLVFDVTLHSVSPFIPAVPTAEEE